MPRNKKVISGRGLPVFGGVNFLVGAIHPHPKNPDQHATLMGDVVKMWGIYIA
jgi:hypothetical protein